MVDVDEGVAEGVKGKVEIDLVDVGEDVAGDVKEKVFSAATGFFEFSGLIFEED